MIHRHLEARVVSLLKQFPCVGVVGARQVGKTTLVKTLQAQTQHVLGKPAQYLDLELPEDRTKLTDAALYLARFSEQLIIIDEIQQMPELFPILRALIDQHRIPSRFLILGSASPALLTRSGESLAGRIAYTELHPLMLSEITTSEAASSQALSNQISSSVDVWEEHWLKGGFPDAFLAAEAESWTWRGNFLQSYRTRDLPQFGINATPVMLDRLLKMTASLSGEILNESMIAKSLGIASATVGAYLDVLEHSYILRRVQSFEANIRKRLVKRPKLYFLDTGLLHRLVGVQTAEELYGSPLSGASFETYVVQQIIAALNETITPYFYRTADGAEIDLVLVKGVKAQTSIEIKRSNSPKIQRGTTLALSDVGTKHNFVLTPSGGDYPLSNNLWFTDLRHIWGHLAKLNVLQG
jgi:predicted AAA+ superfamily ATPase